MPTPLFDKNGVPLGEDDVLLLNAHYYRLYQDSPGHVVDGQYRHLSDANAHERQWDAISCTNGYLHNIQPELAAQAELIGPYAERAALLVCD